MIYAFGGGWGHLTRAKALARAAAPGCRVQVLTNSPYAAVIGRDLTITAARCADCLIVDTFPRGLVGELVDLLQSFSGLKVLVARDLNPAYVDAYDLKAFIQSTYDLVLNPGEGALGYLTAPWLVRSPGELLPRDRAREVFHLSGSRPCIAVCAAGNPEELAWYGAVVSHLIALDAGIDVRAIAAFCPPACPPEYWLSYWPAVDLYNAVDVVVGGAGYNTVYECLACGVPLVARPWARKYDRQWLRARRAAEVGSVTIVEEPAEAAIAALQMVQNGCGRRRCGQNGVDEAVALIHSYKTSA